MQSLNDRISGAISLGLLDLEVPDYIHSNLKNGFGKRKYQIEAFSRFIFYIGNEKFRSKPTQLLFHMATWKEEKLYSCKWTAIFYFWLHGTQVEVRV